MYFEMHQVERRQSCSKTRPPRRQRSYSEMRLNVARALEPRLVASLDGRRSVLIAEPRGRNPRRAPTPRHIAELLRRLPKVVDLPEDSRRKKKS